MSSPATQRSPAAAPLTSRTALRRTLPCSNVISRPSSCACALTISAAHTSAARRGPSSPCQVRKARLAAAIASSSSCSRQLGAPANTSPVAGFTTPKLSAPDTVRPSMVIEITFLLLTAPGLKAVCSYYELQFAHDLRVLAATGQGASVRFKTVRNTRAVPNRSLLPTESGEPRIL